MTNLSDFYETYGTSLATRLAAVPNRPVAYVYVDDNENPVEITSYVSTGLAAEGVPVLTWDNFDEDLDTGGRDNFHLAIKGSFAVLLKALDQAAIKQTRATCRAIVLEAFSLMLADAEDGLLTDEGIQVEVRQIPLEKIGPFSASWFGYGLQFTWLVPIDLSL